MATQNYAPPTMNQSDGIYEFFDYVNIVSDGLFFPVILLVLWIVTFVATKNFSNSRAFTIASFIGAVLSIPLAVLDLVAPRYMYLLIFLTSVGAVWLKLEPN